MGDKILIRLISEKNSKKNDSKKLEEIRRQIRELKKDKKNKEIKVEKVKKEPKIKIKEYPILPIIPRKVIIDNIDITDELNKLKTSTMQEDAINIYNNITSICNNRKMYIKRVLKKNINSYENASIYELKKKVKEAIMSLQKCSNLQEEEKTKRINMLQESIDSYDIEKKELKLKDSIIQEQNYINKIEDISKKLLLYIEREKKSIIKNEEITSNLTKKQREILNGMYSSKIPKCNPNDYLTAFIEYSKIEQIEYEKLIFLIREFYKIATNNEEFNYINETFNKLVRKIIKEYDNSSKKKIYNILEVSPKISIDCPKNDIKYEILEYFMKKEDMNHIDKLIEEMPEIADNYYNNKSIVINVYTYLLKLYNILLDNCKADDKIIQVAEETLTKLYRLNKNDQKELEMLTSEYLSNLKKLNSNTVSKNLVMCRINKLRMNMGLNIVEDIESENYKYLELYYKEQLSNTRRRKHIEKSVLINSDDMYAYSIIKNDNYCVLKIHVIDLTTYFKEGTSLDLLAYKNCINLNEIKEYLRFDVSKEVPTITFEFCFNKGILQINNIYDSIVSITKDEDVSKEYIENLRLISTSEIKDEFNELIKISLAKNSTNIPYIVKCRQENKTYKMMTDLNYIFSKLPKEEANKIFNLLKNTEEIYTLSNNVTDGCQYDTDVLDITCSYTDILMQRIIKSYYNKDINIDVKQIEEYINKGKSKILTK